MITAIWGGSFLKKIFAARCHLCVVLFSSARWSFSFQTNIFHPCDVGLQVSTAGLAGSDRAIFSFLHLILHFFYFLQCFPRSEAITPRELTRFSDSGRCVFPRPHLFRSYPKDENELFLNHHLSESPSAQRISTWRMSRTGGTNGVLCAAERLKWSIF